MTFIPYLKFCFFHKKKLKLISDQSLLQVLVWTFLRKMTNGDSGVDNFKAGKHTHVILNLNYFHIILYVKIDNPQGLDFL